MAEDETPDNVVEFKTPELSIERHRISGRCPHPNRRVNIVERIVYCKKCRERLDPMDVLIDVATGREKQGWKDKAAEELGDLLAHFYQRDLQVRLHGGEVHVSALGTNGQRIDRKTRPYTNAGVIGMLRDALQQLKDRVDKWGDREITYPRFTLLRRRPKDREHYIEVGILSPGSWSRIGVAKDESQALELVRSYQREHSIQGVIENRPSKIWQRLK